MSPIRQVPFSAQNPPRDKEVLAKLLISGQYEEVTKGLQELIRDLPDMFKITLVDAYGSDVSALVLVRNET